MELDQPREMAEEKERQVKVQARIDVSPGIIRMRRKTRENFKNRSNRSSDS